MARNPTLHVLNPPSTRIRLLKSDLCDVFNVYHVEASLTVQPHTSLPRPTHLYGSFRTFFSLPLYPALINKWIASGIASHCRSNRMCLSIIVCLVLHRFVINLRGREFGISATLTSVLACLLVLDLNKRFPILVPRLSISIIFVLIFFFSGDSRISSSTHLALSLCKQIKYKRIWAAFLKTPYRFHFVKNLKTCSGA